MTVKSLLNDWTGEGQVLPIGWPSCIFRPSALRVTRSKKVSFQSCVLLQRYKYINYNYATYQHVMIGIALVGRDNAFPTVQLIVMAVAATIQCRMDTSIGWASGGVIVTESFVPKTLLQKCVDMGHPLEERIILIKYNFSQKISATMLLCNSLSRVASFSEPVLAQCERCAWYHPAEPGAPIPQVPVSETHQYLARSRLR